MNQKVTSLTLQVNDLQHAKASLQSKVSSLEAEMDCVMGRRESCSPSTCMNGGSLISVSKRQTERQTEKQTDRQTDRQTGRKKLSLKNFSREVNIFSHLTYIAGRRVPV